MNATLILMIIIFSILFSFLGLWLVIDTFNNYYAGMGFTIISAYSLLLMYPILETVIWANASSESASTISRFSTCVLAFGLYLLHYFHDEISAVYRQRKTMTLASLIFGLIIGGIWLENAVKISQSSRAPIVHPLMGLLIITQAGLLIQRVTSHSITMGELSKHFNIESTVQPYMRVLFQRLIFIFLGISSLSFIFMKNIVSTPFTLLITVGIVLLAILYKKDPLTSIPIAQPLQAAALIREGSVMFLHVFEASGKTVAEKDEFGRLITELAKFFKEIMKTNSPIRSISTPDILLKFENCNTDHLILILKHQSPLVRRILQIVATAIIRLNPTTNKEFSQIIEQYLLFKKIFSINDSRKN